MRTPFNRSGSPFGTNLPTPARTPQGSGLAANVPDTLRNLGAQAFPSLRPGNPPLALGSTAVEDFFKGCITTGLLVTLQERAERARNADGKSAGKRLDRRAVRMALQGGAALSAGTAAARALRQSRPGAALLTAAAGAAVVLAAERWLADRPARPAVIEVDNLVDDAPESQEDASPRYIQMAHTPRDEMFGRDTSEYRQRVGNEPKIGQRR